MRPRLYADALFHLSTEKSGDAVAESLIAYLKRQGRLKLLPHILREYRLRVEKAQNSAPRIEAASEGEIKEAQEEAAQKGISVSQTSINQSLIHGWSIRTKDTLHERSAKKALVGLYRSIIRNR